MINIKMANLHIKNLIYTNFKIILFLIFVFIISCTNFPVFAATVQDLTLYSKHYILMDYDTGAILYTNGAQDKIYPASTTKILTAILAIEKGNLEDTIVASKNAIYTMPEGSSTAGIKPGEVMKIKDILHCLLLQSANECGNILAEYVSGNISDFVKLMNEKAKELGCKNTNFVNPHGFHDDNHYTTPEDMMIILRYAMKSESFRQIMETKTYTVGPTNIDSEPKKLTNTNRLLFTTDEIGTLGQYYEYCLGGKTGYTIEAERTFVGYGKKNNKTLLVGTFGAMNVNGKDGRFLDCVNLFEYGFNNFNYENKIKKHDFKFSIIDKKNMKTYNLSINSDLDILINDSYPTIIEYSLDLPEIDNITDLSINQELGSINFNISNGISRLNIEKPLIVTDITNNYSATSVKNFILSTSALRIVRLIAIIAILILAFILIFSFILVKSDPDSKYYNKHYEKIKKFLSSEEEIVFNRKKRNGSK